MSPEPAFDGAVVAVTEVVAGEAAGPALVLDEPLSLWGGLDPESGLIIDQHHPQHGLCVSGVVLFMACGRGSSSASSVLAEAVRLGTAPAAFVLHERDEIIALGSLVAEEVYGLVTPVVVVDPIDVADLQTGRQVQVGNGSIRLGGILSR